ncbi:DUF2029 domain-containing protein [Altererythrobacter soli]|uniref:DUF2029 domain-containing protein n=2 Tax=Croceibacterium soli TaxID=1739690 RepID=A0A6I4UV50_9SPHN|nr:DUF2029 domain-containing protein [Croceibacterium soli]
MGVGFFRDADWLGPRRARGYLWLLALLNLASIVLLTGTSNGGIDRHGLLLGSDFLSFWTTGGMLQVQENIYDPAAHFAAQQAFFVQEGAHTAFFYPPPFLLICYLLGFLPYFPALAVWLLATGAVYFATVRLWLRRSGIRWSALLILAAFPPVVITVTHGQTSFLVAALLGLGVLLARAHPLLAGICFGLATIKPQLGILIPLVLLVTGEWRVIAAAAVTAVLLGLAATAAFDPAVWLDWIAVSETAQAAMTGGLIGFGKMQSPFAAAMLLGASPQFAYTVQGLVSLAVTGALCRAAWRKSFSPALGAAMLAGAPLATPFVFDYDLVLLAFPLIWLTGSGFRRWEKLIAAGAFIAAAFARPLAMSFSIPIMPLVLAAFFIVITRRALDESNDRSPAPSPRIRSGARLDAEPSSA